MTKTKLKGNFWNSQNVFLILKNRDIQKSKAEIFKYNRSKTEIVKHYFVPSFLSIFWVSSFGLVVKAVNFKSEVRGFKPPSGKNVILKFFFWFVFWTKIGLFFIVIHKKRHKWSLFYYLKVHYNCSFSFSLQMTFSISQQDVANFKNWDMPRKRFPEYISGMQTNILEHFFK